MPQRAVPDVELLVQRSHQLGQQHAASGSTSVKTPAAAGSPWLLQVSADGADLAGLTRDAIVALELDTLSRLLQDADALTALARSRCEGPAPAADAVLHALVPQAHVDVLQSDAVLALALAVEGSALVARCLGDTVGWVDAASGPTQIAQAVRAAATADPELRGVVVSGYGLVTWGETSEQCLAATREAVAAAERLLAEAHAPEPAVPGSRPAADPAQAVALFPVLRRLASASQRRVGHLDDSGALLELLSRADTSRLVPLAAGLLPAELAAVLLEAEVTAEEVAARADDGGAPAVFLVPGVGLFAFGRDKRAAAETASAWVRALRIVQLVEAVGSYESGAATHDLLAPRGHGAPVATLTGRIALVTGGGSGIGRAVATLLAAQGACVVVADLDLAAAEKTVSELADRECGIAVEVDVRDEDAVRTAVDATVHAFGGLDLLVNNAGLSISKPLNETSSADWDLQHDVMARGSFLVAQAAARVMQVQQLDSDIVYVVSKNAAFAGPNNLAYGAAKANQAHQVRLLAAELGPSGVRVNGVSPDGVVQGSGIFANGWGQERAKVYGVPVDELGTFYAQRTLLKREVLPSHVADAVLALCSGLLSRTTGAILPVDGGVTGAFLR
jgi:NAD(P)-dependent dehydrogenase (short-subunit alcohol dehydrogenase family)